MARVRQLYVQVNIAMAFGIALGLWAAATAVYPARFDAFRAERALPPAASAGAPMPLTTPAPLKAAGE